MLKANHIIPEFPETITEGLFDGKPSEANKYKQSLKAKIAKLQRYDNGIDHAGKAAPDGRFIRYDDLMKMVNEW